MAIADIEDDLRIWRPEARDVVQCGQRNWGSNPLSSLAAYLTGFDSAIDQGYR